MDVCGGCGATLGPQEQFCGACGRFRSDATTRVWPPQDATAPQAWPPQGWPPQDAPPQAPLPPPGSARAAAPAYGGAPGPYGYGQPIPGYYYGPVMPASRTNVLAIISLVAGLVGFVACFVPSIVAVVTGHIGLSQIARSGRGGPYTVPETGRGLAIAGLVLGYIGVGLGVLFWVLAFAGGTYD
jgi:hypothetical protein